MQTYYMFGRYSPDVLNHISPTRTEECSHIIEDLGGEIILMDALLGDYDLAFIVKFETNSKAMEASLAISKATGISFTTWPAIPVDDLDRMV